MLSSSIIILTATLLLIFFLVLILENIKGKTYVNTKYLFVHIPKTGGNAIKKTKFFINNCEYFHHDFITKITQTYMKSFCFSRNPYDRLVSAYFYLKKGGMNEWDREVGDRINKYKTFKDFCKNIELFKEDIHFCPQYKFISNKTIVLKYENIDNDYNNFIVSEGFEKENLKKVNTSNHHSYLRYYDTESADLIYKAYEKDFKTFRYSRKI